MHVKRYCYNSSNLCTYTMRRAQTPLWFCLQFLCFLLSAAEFEFCDTKDAPRHSSPFVRASIQKPLPVSGCWTGRKTEALEEVYAVVAQRSRNDTEDAVATETAVDVFLDHDVDDDNDNKTKRIFIFVSERPTRWRIHSNHHRRGLLGDFWISGESRIVSHDLRINARKAKISSYDVKTLESFVVKKWGAVTSLILLHRSTNLVTIFLENNDLKLSSSCSVQDDLPNVHASFVDEQMTSGCFSQFNETIHQRDVHIIELISAPGSSGMGNRVPPDVYVGVHQRSRSSLSKHVFLVLKSHRPIKWRISTDHIRGTLFIITDQFVDVGRIKMRNFQITAERLGSFGRQELIRWTSEKYGPPMSYTSATIANRFDVTIDDDERLNEENARKLDSNDDTKTRSTDNVKDLKILIVRSLSLKCRSNGMKISILKHPLRNNLILTRDVTLANTSCRTVDHEKHLTIFTRYSDCGTRRLTTRDGGSVFTNAIVFHRQTSGQQDGVAGSSSSVTSLNERDPIVINVSCDYLAPKDAVFTSASRKIRFRLKLFRDGSFLDEIVDFPAQVSTSDGIFVEASIADANYLRVLIRNCLMESTGTSSKDHHLIINGCSVDGSVRWIHDTDDDVSIARQRFEIHPHRYDRQIDSAVNLKCSLSVCSRQNHDASPTTTLRCNSDLFECGPSKNTSALTTLQSGLVLKSVTRGPLVLVSFFNDSKHSSTKGVGDALPQLPQAPVMIDSLPETMNAVKTIATSSCEDVVEGVSSRTAVGIAFAAFAIGVILMSSLWYIHVRTEPRKKIGQHLNRNGKILS